MKTIKNIGLVLLIAGIFASCEDVVEVDLGDQLTNLFAVEAQITTESNPYVYLYNGERVNYNEPYQGISGARVVISSSKQPYNPVRLTEHPSLEGFYTVPAGVIFRGEPGRKYTVQIDVGDVTLTATDTLAKVEPIDSIRVKPSLRGDSLFLGIFTYGNEPKGTGNYYKWNIYITDTLLNDAMNIVIASDEFVDGRYINGLEIFTDFHNPDNPEERKIMPGDTVQVKQMSLSEFSYGYYFQMINQSQTGGLFSVPTANVQSNFTASDGKPVLGLFTAHDVSSSNKVIIGEEIESQLKK